MDGYVCINRFVYLRAARTFSSGLISPQPLAFSLFPGIDPHDVECISFRSSDRPICLTCQTPSIMPYGIYNRTSIKIVPSFEMPLFVDYRRLYPKQKINISAIFSCFPRIKRGLTGGLPSIKLTIASLAI